MIGNDIVDLRDPETDPGALHPGFDRRVFTEREQRAIASSSRPNVERWACWAAKEAAYKRLRQEEPRIVFSPRQLAVSGLGERHRTVAWEGRSVHVELDLSGSAIHAVTAADTEAERVIGVAQRELSADPSAAVRALAARSLAPHLGVEPDAITIGPGRGAAPRVTLQGRDFAPTLSLSHHGQLVAFACELPSAAG